MINPLIYLHRWIYYFNFAIAMRTIIVGILLGIIITSCATHNKTIQVPVEVPNTHYHYDSKVRDIIVYDSVSRWTYGDTVYIYREKTKVINLADTLIRKDSVSSTVILESVDELNIEYLDKLNGIKSLMLKILSQ